MADLGQDLSCIEDLDESMSEVSGLRCLAEALARRITTPRGRLIDDPNYGIDVADWLEDDLTDAELGQVAAQIDGEIGKDERVVSSSTVVTFNGGVLIATISGKSGAGPFKFVLAIDAVTTTILKVS